MTWRSLVAAVALGACRADATSPPPAVNHQEDAAALLEALQDQRASAGLEHLDSHPVLSALAEERARSLAARGASAEDVTAVTNLLHRRGYRPWMWREATVCCDVPAAAMARVELQRDLIEGRWEHAAAACADGPHGRLCLVVVALPRLTIERERTAWYSSDREAIRTAVLEAVNQARTRRGLGPLVHDAQLAEAAQRHAEAMASRNFYAHLDPEGRRPSDRARAAGFEYREIAENLAEGQFTAEEVVGRWLDSSDHRRNVLRTSSTHHGLGLATAERDGRVEVYWCQLIGAPR